MAARQITRMTTAAGVESGRVNVLAGMRLKKNVELVGRSPEMLALQHELERVARSDAKVLITGESGVGKEIVARTIHTQSPRASHVFAPVNCAGLPETLLESELFGHVKEIGRASCRERV